MTGIVFLIEQTAIALYIFIGIGIFWYWLKWRAAGRSYRMAQFELERDLSMVRRGSALTAIVLLI